jgi:branched-chain amino acid transport system ATP-binding protein
LGPNGAGKTTFFNCMTGLYVPDGERSLRLRRHTARRPTRRTRPPSVGIARTFQNIRLFGNMTALENVMVGRHVRTRVGRLWRDAAQLVQTRDEEAAIRAARRRTAALRRCIEERARRLWRKNLSYGDQRRLEIARALATEPKLLCLDEPAAGMNGTETEELRLLIEGIRADGVTILLIEHDVKLVMGLCDRVAVLDYGALIIEDVPSVVQHDPRVIEAYIGVAA